MWDSRAPTCHNKIRLFTEGSICNIKKQNLLILLMQLAHLHSHRLHGAFKGLCTVTVLHFHTYNLTFSRVAYSLKLQRSSINRRNWLWWCIRSCKGQRKNKTHLVYKHFSSKRITLNECKRRDGPLLVQNGEVTKFLLVQCLFSPPSFCKSTWSRWSLVHVTWPLRNKSTFSWNDTLKCEVLEWMFWVCCSVWSSCQKTKSKFKTLAYAFHLCKTNTMTNGQLRYQNKFKQNYNRSFKTKQKRGTDVSTRVVPRVRKLRRDSSQLAAK